MHLYGDPLCRAGIKKSLKGIESVANRNDTGHFVLGGSLEAAALERPRNDFRFYFWFPPERSDNYDQPSLPVLH